MQKKNITPSILIKSEFSHLCVLTETTASGSTGSSVTTYTYDLNNRLLNETAVYSSKTKTTDYTYDFNGNLTDKFYTTINNVYWESVETMLSLFPINSEYDIHESFIYNNQ